MGHPPRILSAGLFACLILLYFSPAFAARECTVGCHGFTPGKDYQVGQTYVYDYEGTSVTSVSESQGDSTLNIKANVELTIKPNCLRQLRVKNAQINGAPIQLKDVEQHALQFNYHNGHIDNEVCAEPGDSQASLNIKRAIASLFQTAVMQDSGSTTHMETDVFGGCATDFHFQKDGDDLTVRKERNLMHCRNRETLREAMVSSVLDPSSPVQSSPLLDAHYKSEQKFKAGVLNHADVMETYKLEPFSNGEAGAKTIIKSSLKLKSQKADAGEAKVSLPKSLIYEAPHPVAKATADDIMAALKKVKDEETEEGVKPKAAWRLSELIKVLRSSNKKDILSVYQRDKSGKKILLDALFATGTGEAMEAAVELMKGQEFTSMEMQDFFMSLFMVQHVNLPSVTSITALLDQPELPRLGYLGVGQIIGMYCQQHECENVPEIKKAVAKIMTKVGNGKAETRPKEDKIIAALKALRNARYIDDEELKKIMTIAADKKVRNRVRASAIETLSARCSKVWIEPLSSVYGDYEEDSEIRIRAYLSLVACANPQVAEKISAILDNEKSNQVGSYVSTHLRNLRATIDPNKMEAKRQLGQIHPKKRFPEDFRKFSFNSEFSYNIPGIGSGETGEGNVIYSQNSFIPRAMSLNLTNQVFGRSFNYFELSSRIENLDHVIEHFFGPKGDLMNLDLRELASLGADRLESLWKYVMQKLEMLKRNKREVKHEDLQKFAKSVRLRENEVDDSIDIDLSMKMFGVEMIFLSLEGSADSHDAPENIIDKIFEKLEKSLDKVKDFNHNIEEHIQFMQSEAIYPTGLGLPLNLEVSGEAVIHVKTSGKIDVPAILKDPQNAVVKVALEPSASVRVAGMMAVEGLEPKQVSGMKLVTVMHTSTGSDLTVKVLNGRGIDINLGIPKKKQELISVESMVLIHNGKEFVPPKFAKGREHADCFDQFATLIGVTVCGHISYPYDSLESVQQKPLFPLSGPAKFAVTIENNDVSSYHFKTLYDIKKPKERSFEILLETPNSRTNRKVSLLIEAATEPDKYGKIIFESPLKKASIEGRLKNSPQERSLSMAVTNDQNEYFFKAGLMANGNKYKPLLEYKVPEHVEKLTSAKAGKPGTQTYNVDGTVDVADVDGGKKFTFDKVVLKAAGRDVASLDGSVTTTPTYVAADASLGYGPEKIAIKADAKKIKDGKYSLDLTAVPSKNPEIGFAINYEMEKGANKWDQKLMVTHGPDLKSTVNRITFEEHGVLNLGLDDFKVYSDRQISYPAMNFLMKVKYGLTRKSIEGDLEFQYDKFKFGTELEAKTGVKKPGDYELEFEAEVLQNKVELKSQREIVDDHTSKFTNALELSPGRKYTSDVTLHYEVVNTNIDIQMDGELNLNGQKVNVNAGLDNKPQKLTSKALLSVDGNKYVDFQLKVDRGDKPNGNLVLNLKNYLTANGQFNYQGGKGNAMMVVDIPKINRKIKGTSDIAITGNNHVMNAEILYDAEKDPSRRIKFSTVSDITKTSIDTKNTIEILTYKIEVNGNGKIQGRPFVDGQVNGEVEVSLPTGRYMVAKGKYNVARKGDVIDYSPELELTDYIKKGGESQKFSYTGEAKDVDTKKMIYKAKHNFKYVYFNGKDIDVSMNMKVVPGKDAGRREGEMKLTIGGAVMPRKFMLDANTDVGKQWSSWDVKSSLGDNLSMNTNGKYVKGEVASVPYTLDGVLSMTLPSEKLKNFKVEVHEELKLPADLQGDLERKRRGVITYNDDKKITMDMEYKKSGIMDNEHQNSGNMKVMIGILDKPPYGISANYKYNIQENKRILNVGVQLSPYDVKGNFEFSRNADWSDIMFTADGSSKVEHFKQVEMSFKHKKSDDSKSRKTDISLKADDKNYALNSELVFDPAASSMEVIITLPDGKIELTSTYERMGEMEFKSFSSLKAPSGFVTLSRHVKFENEDNFLIEVDLDSNKLKERKIHAEVAGTANPKTGKRIHVTVTSDGKNLLSGSMNINKREEEDKTIIDGSGELKVLDATRSSSFKYSRQRLTMEKHGERGYVSTLHANFDPSAIVSEVRVTNKEALFFASYCEKSKDCTQMKLHSKWDTDKKTRLNHQVTVEANLRKLNVPLEFGFRSNMKYERFSYDHLADLYLHSTKDKSEYGYHAYWNMKEAGVVFNTPNREVALISSHEFPKSKHTGAYKMETALYLDKKNKPNDKTSLMVNGDVNLEKNMLSVTGEAKFIYPSQPKDMIIKGKLHSGGDSLFDANVDIDVFAKKAQKINIIAKVVKTPITKGYNISSDVQINSDGQQLAVNLREHLALSPTEISFGSMLSYTDVKAAPRTVGALFSANMKGAHLLVTGPNQNLLTADTNMDLSKNLQKIDTEIKVLDSAPIVMNFKATDWNTMSFTYAHKDAPNDKLTANGRIVLGQLTEFHVDNYAKGDKKNLLSALIHLDESNFLKPEFSYDKDNIAAVIEHYRTHLNDYWKQMKKVAPKLGNEAVTELKDLFEHLKKAQPNLKPLIDYYQTELKKLKEELHADATVQEIEAVLKKTFGALFEVIVENVKQMATRTEELYNQMSELATKLMEALKSASPQIKASIDKVIESGMEVLKTALNLAAVYFQAIVNVINEHQKELKEIIGVASEIAQDVAKIVFKAYSQIEKDVKDFVVLLIQQLKALPVYDFMKEKYQELLNFQVPEAVLAPAHELFENIKNILPNKELKDFVEITYEYIMKLIRKEKVDDTNELKKIWAHAVIAAHSIIELLQNKVTFDSVMHLFDTKFNADLSFFKQLPGLASLRISVINLLINGEIPSIADIYYTFRPTLHILDIVPPFSMAATVANGGHIFTFDGRHITLPGSCNYILAQDMRDGNFSVVAELNNGNLLGVTVTDPKESITIKPKGVILYNNKPSDFPLNADDKTKNLHAFYTPPSVHVKSSYGLHMICTNTEQLLCNLHVSGFYLGKLRGLFGDGNNEPYDDFTLPSGKITESDTEFANAYKLNPSCPDVAPMKHEGIPRAPICTEYFSGYSSMSKCFNYVDPSNWRHGCDHAIAAGDKDGACVIAIAYFAACREKRIFVNIPPACSKCKTGTNEVMTGESFSVKMPKKAADIIFVVEEESHNEKVYKELIVPLISELKNELKQQGMTDVYTGLIGFGEKMRWPQHYTLNGNLNVDGEAKNMKFTDKEPLLTYEEVKSKDIREKLKFLKQRLDVELGTFKLTDAYEQAIKYRFRPDAAKAVVGVLVSPCEKSPLPISLQHLRLIVGQKTYRDLGLTYYHMFNTGEILVNGKEQKNIVGYDYDSAYTFADAKKKPLEGSSSMRSNLALSNNDVCARFAVSSGGAAFSTHNFAESKPNHRKQFIQVAARRIADGLANLELEEDCTCSQYHGLVGQSHCKIVSRKEKEHRHKKA